MPITAPPRRPTAPPDGPRGAATSAPPASTTAGWIPEVQGMRTLAIVLVAVYHVWFDRVSGGVDIFLLISAFLMTRSLYGRLERGEPVRPVGYLVRRFARLMPLAIGIAALTLVASVLFLPLSRLRQYVEQFLASSLYFENVWLQNAVVDYFADPGDLASPFQHYWSLSIQGQVFVLWPLAFVVIWAVRRVWNVPLRPFALGVFGAVLVVGFAWSIVLTAIDQPYAYFDLGARLWEFAAGSVLALIMPWMRFGAITRGILTWVGIAMAITGGLLLPVDATFPGVAALWPVTAAALVIVGAGAPTRFGGDCLLAHPAMTRAGAYTYALYLVHWPVLIIGIAVLRIDRPNVLEGAAMLLISGALSVLAVHVIERPIAAFAQPGSKRRGWPWRAGVVVAVLPGLALATTAFSSSYIDRNEEAALHQVYAADLSVLGPNATPEALEIPPDWAIPSAWVAGRDLGWMLPCLPDMLAPGMSEEAIHTCQANINVVDHDRAERHVWVVGNSHAQQVAQLVGETARHEGWALRAHLRFGCQFGGLALGEEGVDPCLRMWQDATIDIMHHRPDVVFVMATWSAGEDLEFEFAGLPDWIADLTAEGIEVVAVRDNPRSELHMVDCGERWGFGSDRCAWPTTLTEPNDEVRRSIEEAGGIYLDPNPHICPDGVCRPQHGGLVAFFDNNHISATYARALAYTVAPHLGREIAWWPERLGDAHPS